MFVANGLSAQSFLKKFNGESKLVNGGNIKGEIYNALTLKDALKNNKQKNLDVYFYVNAKNRVKEFRSCFIDLDAGRDDKGNYLTLKQVEDKKKDMWQEIQKLSLPPNLIVDSRNGYHLYWLLKDKCTLAEWKRTQNRICNNFLHVGGDPLAIKPTQLLRVPGTTWFKNYEVTQASYDVTWMDTGNPKYTIDEIDNGFKLSKPHPTWVFVNTANISGFSNKKRRKPEKYIYLKSSQAKKLLNILGLVIDMKLPVEKQAMELVQIVSGKDPKPEKKTKKKPFIVEDEEEDVDWDTLKAVKMTDDELEEQDANFKAALLNLT